MAASRSGYGSGASARTLYTSRKAFSENLDRFVRLSISVWYAARFSEVYLQFKAVIRCTPLRRPLKADNLSSSGIFLNSKSSHGCGM